MIFRVIVTGKVEADDDEVVKHCYFIEAKDEFDCLLKASNRTSVKVLARVHNVECVQMG